MIPLVNESILLELNKQQAFVQRNRSHSTGSSTASDSPPDSPVFQAPPDLNSLSLALQAASLKDNLNLQEAAKVVGGSRYKTEFCNSIKETGQCKYGDKCQFAHSLHEIRAMPRHPKYKTLPCKTFHSTGLCPYGIRCHFIHNEDPQKLVAITQSKQNFIAQQAASEMVRQAVSLRTQQQQLNALVTQVQQHLITNLAMQNSVNAALHSSTAARVQPQFLPATRVVPQPVLTSRLPETPSVSPICGSPVFNRTYAPTTPLTSSPRSAALAPPPGFRPCVRGALDFSDVTDLGRPLMTSSMDLDTSDASSGGYTPPSSPDSFLQNASKGRLPVFNQLCS